MLGMERNTAERRGTGRKERKKEEKQEESEFNHL